MFNSGDFIYFLTICYIAYTVFYHVLSINVVGLFNVILLRLVIYVYQHI